MTLELDEQHRQQEDETILRIVAFIRKYSLEEAGNLDHVRRFLPNPKESTQGIWDYALAKVIIAHKSEFKAALGL